MTRELRLSEELEDEGNNAHWAFVSNVSFIIYYSDNKFIATQNLSHFPTLLQKSSNSIPPVVDNPWRWTLQLYLTPRHPWT